MVLSYRKWERKKKINLQKTGGNKQDKKPEISEIENGKTTYLIKEICFLKKSVKLIKIYQN